MQLALLRRLYRHMEWADALVWRTVLSGEAAGRDDYILSAGNQGTRLGMSCQTRVGETVALTVEQTFYTRVVKTEVSLISIRQYTPMA